MGGGGLSIERKTMNKYISRPKETFEGQQCFFAVLGLQTFLIRYIFFVENVLLKRQVNCFGLEPTTV